MSPTQARLIALAGTFIAPLLTIDKLITAGKWAVAKARPELAKRRIQWRAVAAIAIAVAVLIMLLLGLL